jgi:exodeoxyribonuclease VIII
VIAPVRFSTLKHIARSPAHYRHALTTERPDTPAMRLGRLVHWHVLGGMPDDEEGRVAIYDGERRGNAWKEFAAAHKNDEIVTRKEWEAALPIADAVNLDPYFRQLKDGAALEQRIEWSIAGRAWASRPDAFRPGSMLLDLKTTTDASPIGFARQAWKMGYHAQLAAYEDALAFHDISVPDKYLVAVETRAPYPVTVLRLTPTILEEGRRLYRAWFERLRVCEENDHWPAYTEHVETLDVPAWHDVDAGVEEEAA